MYEQIQLARNLLRMAWLYRWVGVALAVVLCLGGWIYVYSMPDQYRVQTKIYLDSTSMLRPLLKGMAFNSGLRDTSLLLKRTLLTRPNLEDISRRADLDLKAKTPEEFDRIVGRLGTNIKIISTKRDNIYDIIYTDNNPKTAKVVIDELLNVFLESSLGDARKETAVTQRFIEEQLAEYEKRLHTAEERLKEFKQRNIGVMPGSQGGYFNKLQETQSALKQAELDLQEAIRRRDDIKKLISSGAAAQQQSMFSMEFEEEYTDPEIDELVNRIATIQLKIDELLIQYTEKHPDVVGARRTIETLAETLKQKREEFAERMAQMPDDPLSAPSPDNLYAQQLKLQVVEAEAVVGALQTRVEEYQRRVEDLEHKVDTVPEVEAELARLDRDYAINRQQYDQLLKRREMAHLSQEADATVDDVKIKVIEPPRLPLAPVGPPRLLYISITLLAALGIGAASSFVLSQLNPRVIGDTDLKSITDIPVIGAIGMVENPVHKRQRRMEIALLCISLTGLIGVYLGQVLLLQAGIDLHQKMNGLIGVVL